jgi:hypothetical protein
MAKDKKNYIMGYVVGRVLISVSICKSKKEFREKLTGCGYSKINASNLCTLSYGYNKSTKESFLFWSTSMDRSDLNNKQINTWSGEAGWYEISDCKTKIDPLQKEEIIEYLKNSLDHGLLIPEKNTDNIEVEHLIKKNSSFLLYYNERKEEFGVVENKYQYQMEAAVKLKWDYNLNTHPNDISKFFIDVMTYKGNYYVLSKRKNACLEMIENNECLAIVKSKFRKSKLELLNL